MRIEEIETKLFWLVALAGLGACMLAAWRIVEFLLKSMP